MSEGTCDQAYLALRLASLEIYLENHEPLPFIVDDILVNFDDARSHAGSVHSHRIGHTHPGDFLHSPQSYRRACPGQIGRRKNLDSKIS